METKSSLPNVITCMNLVEDKLFFTGPDGRRYGVQIKLPPAQITDDIKRRAIQCALANPDRYVDPREQGDDLITLELPQEFWDHLICHGDVPDADV